MSETQSISAPSEEELRSLQKTLLRAVLLSEPLPGGDQPLIIPDLDLILRQPIVVLSDENLAGSLSIEESPKPIRILSQEDLLQEARLQGDLAYFHFQPPNIDGNAVRLTLEMKIAPRDPSQHTLGLGGVQARFQKISQWEVIEEPIFFAM